jgi:hypothetical protein
MAPRWGGLRPDPYKPDAVDADRDGIVQEDTAFERPVGTRLLTRLGEAITAGFQTIEPIEGLRIIDTAGNDVAYRPRWVDKITEADLPDAEVEKLRTIQDMGARTVGDMSSPIKNRIGTVGDAHKARKRRVQQMAAELKKPNMLKDAPAALGSFERPHEVTDLDQALELIEAGYFVKLKHEGEIFTLVDRLGELAAEAKILLENKEITEADVPNWNMCLVQVPGTNIFCHEQYKDSKLNNARSDMPQIGGSPVPGTDAAALLEKDVAEAKAKIVGTALNKKGKEISVDVHGDEVEIPNEVDGTDAYIADLESRGIKVTREKRVAASLHSSQNELVGGKVAGMVKGGMARRKAIEAATHGRPLKDKKNNPITLEKAEAMWHPGKKAIFVSSDGYVIDGHHRFAAVLGVDAFDGVVGEDEMDVIVVDLSIHQVLEDAREFSGRYGIKAKSAVVNDLAAAEGKTDDIPELIPEEVLTPELTVALDELTALSRELEELIPRTNKDADAGVADELFDRGKSVTKVIGKQLLPEFGLEEDQFNEHEKAVIPALTERGQELIDKIDAVGERIEALSAALIKERSGGPDNALTAAIAKLEEKKEEARQAYYSATRPLRERLAETIVDDVLKYFEDYTRLGPALAGGGSIGHLQPGEQPPRNFVRRMLSGVPLSKEEDKRIFRKRMLEGLGKLNVLAVDGVSGQRPLDGGTGSVAGGVQGLTEQVEQLIREALEGLIPESHKEDLFSTDSRRRGLLAHLIDEGLGHQRIAAYQSTEDGMIEQPLMEATRQAHIELRDIKPNDTLVIREVNRQIMKVLRPDHGTETLTLPLRGGRDVIGSFDEFSEEDRALVQEAITIASAHMPASWVRFMNRKEYGFHFQRRAVHLDPTADRPGSIGIGGRLVGEGSENYSREQRLIDGVRQIIHEIGHAMSDPDNGDHDLTTGRGGRGNFRYVMAQSFISDQLSKTQLSSLRRGNLTSSSPQLIHLKDLSAKYDLKEMVWMFDGLRDEPEMAYVFKYYRGLLSDHDDARADPVPDGEVLSMGAEMIMAGTTDSDGPLEKALRAHSWGAILMGLDDSTPEGEPFEGVLPENEIFVRPLDNLGANEIMDEFRKYAVLYEGNTGRVPNSDRVREYKKVLSDRIRGRGLMPGDPEPAKTVEEVLERLVELDKILNPASTLPDDGWAAPGEVGERLKRLRQGVPASVSIRTMVSEAADPRERKQVTHGYNETTGVFTELPKEQTGEFYQTWEEWLFLDEGDEWTGIKVPVKDSVRLGAIRDDPTVMPKPPPESDAIPVEIDDVLGEVAPEKFDPPILTHKFGNRFKRWKHVRDGNPWTRWMDEETSTLDLLEGENILTPLIEDVNEAEDLAEIFDTDPDLWVPDGPGKRRLKHPSEMTDEELAFAIAKWIRREEAKGAAYERYISTPYFEDHRIDMEDPEDIVNDAAIHASDFWREYYKVRDDNEPRPYVTGDGGPGVSHARNRDSEYGDTLEETEALLAEMGMDELPDEISQEDYDKIPYGTPLKGLFHEPYDSEGNQTAQGTRKLGSDGMNMRDALASTKGDTVGRRRKRIFGTDQTSLDAPGETATGLQGTNNLAVLILEKAFRRPLTDKEKSRIDKYNLFIRQVTGHIDSTNTDDTKPAVTVGRIIYNNESWEPDIDAVGDGAVLHIDETMRKELKASGVRSIIQEMTDEERAEVRKAFESLGLAHWSEDRMVAEIHNIWADSSGDSDPRSLALQMAVAREAGWSEEEIAARVFHTYREEVLGGGDMELARSMADRVRTKVLSYSAGGDVIDREEVNSGIRAAVMIYKLAEISAGRLSGDAYASEEDALAHYSAPLEAIVGALVEGDVTGAADAAIMAAERRLTLEFLREAAGESGTITVYRGIKYMPDDDPIETALGAGHLDEDGNFIASGTTGSMVSFDQSPMTSWSFSRGVAQMFTGEATGAGGSQQYVVSAEVPIENIVGTSAHGFGCLEEAEVIVGPDTHPMTIVWARNAAVNSENALPSWDKEPDPETPVAVGDGPRVMTPLGEPVPAGDQMGTTLDDTPPPPPDDEVVYQPAFGLDNFSKLSTDVKVARIREALHQGGLDDSDESFFGIETESSIQHFEPEQVAAMEKTPEGRAVLSKRTRDNYTILTLEKTHGFALKDAERDAIYEADHVALTDSPEVMQVEYQAVRGLDERIERERTPLAVLHQAGAGTGRLDPIARDNALNDEGDVRAGIVDAPYSWARIYIPNEVRETVKEQGVESILALLDDHDLAAIIESLGETNPATMVWRSGALEVNAPWTQAAMTQRIRMIVYNVHNGWAQSAGDHHADGLAFQLAVAREEGMSEDEIVERVFHILDDAQKAFRRHDASVHVSTLIHTGKVRMAEGFSDEDGWEGSRERQMGYARSIALQIIANLEQAAAEGALEETWDVDGRSSLDLLSLSPEGLMQYVSENGSLSLDQIRAMDNAYDRLHHELSDVDDADVIDRLSELRQFDHEMRAVVDVVISDSSVEDLEALRAIEIPEGDFTEEEAQALLDEFFDDPSEPSLVGMPMVQRLERMTLLNDPGTLLREITLRFDALDPEAGIRLEILRARMDMLKEVARLELERRERGHVPVLIEGKGNTGVFHSLGIQAAVGALVQDHFHGERNRAVVRAEQRAAQKMGEKSAGGAKTITVYRGVKYGAAMRSAARVAQSDDPYAGDGSPEDAIGEIFMDTDASPLSSWSFNLATAQSFAHGMGGQPGRTGYVIATEIPVEDLRGTSSHGLGCLVEAECLVVGKERRVKVIQALDYHDFIDNPLLQVTDAGEYIRVDENGLPILQDEVFPDEHVPDPDLDRFIAATALARRREERHEAMRARRNARRAEGQQGEVPDDTPPPPPSQRRVPIEATTDAFTSGGARLEDSPLVERGASVRSAFPGYYEIQYGDLELEIEDNYGYSWADEHYTEWSAYEGNYRARHVSAALMGLAPPVAEGSDAENRNINEIIATGNPEPMDPSEEGEIAAIIYGAWKGLRDINNAEADAPELHRGLGDVDPDSPVLSLRPGDTFVTSLTAWTPDPVLASQFAQGTDDDAPEVMFVLAPGARAVAPDADEYPADYDSDEPLAIEYVTQGEFRITSVTEDDSDVVRIEVEHVATYDVHGGGYSPLPARTEQRGPVESLGDAPSPEELRGLGPTRAEVSAADEALSTVLRDADGYRVTGKELFQLAINSDHADADVDGIPRMAFLAEYQGGDYDDWLIEQIERDYGLTGLTKAHIDQLLADLRANGRRNLPETITVYRADDGDLVGRLDRADLGPVSVATDRASAEDYGEVREYDIPREAIEFAGSEAGELIVDPAFLKRVEDA